MQNNLLDIGAHIQKHYNINVITAERITQGLQNDNYRVETSVGDFLFKIYNFRKREEVKVEFKLLRYLAERGFPCPRVVLTQSGTLSEPIDGKYAVLLVYIHGATLAESDITPVLMRRIGALTGRMHRLLKDRVHLTPRETWEPEDVAAYIKKNAADMLARPMPDAEMFVSYIKSELATLDLPASLPKSITHQDIKPDNIVVGDDSTISIIDFDNAYRGVSLYDMLTPVIWMCFKDARLSPELLAAYLDGYARERPLTEQEQEYFFDALRFRLLREAFVWPAKWLHPETSPRLGAEFLARYRDVVDRKAEIIKILTSTYR